MPDPIRTAYDVRRAHRRHRDEPGEMTMALIRDARADELDAVAAVMVAAYEEYIPPDATGDLAAYREDIRDVRGRQAHATLILAEERARIIGAVTYYPDGSGDAN